MEGGSTMIKIRAARELKFAKTTLALKTGYVTH